MAKERWYDVFESTWGATMTDLDPRNGSHEQYSPGYRPDLVAFYQGNSRMHLIADVKVVSVPIRVVCHPAGCTAGGGGRHGAY